MKEDLKEAAKSLRGCLSHLRTEVGRRQVQNEEEDPLDMSNPFVSDEAKLLSSKAFRLLEHKTQVVTAPRNPLIRNRKNHVLEVQAISVVAANLLGLNIDLARAIAIGHDIGHVPFGHPGEEFMAKEMDRKDFCHEVMAPLVAQKIERRGKGLNLTFETLEGMMRHSGNTARVGMTPEAWVVRHTDKFGYIFHDYNDITKRMHYPIPREIVGLMNEFGRTQRERTSTALAGLMIESYEHGKVSFEHSDLAKKFQELRKMMMGVYVHITQQNVADTMGPVLDFLKAIGIGDPYLIMALMTDKDVMYLSEQPTKDMTHFQQTAVSETLEYLHEVGPLDLCSPYLDW